MNCPSCKHKNAHGQKFCGNCGSRLVASPGKKNEAERRRVTLLAAEVSGFASRCESLPPEEALELLYRCLEAFEGAARNQEGTLIRSFRNEALVLFWTEGAKEKGAEQALRAALEMQAALAGIGMGGEMPLSLAAGIHQGEVVFAQAGGKESKTSAVLGEAVAVARGLQEAAQPGEILGSEPVVREVEGLFEFEAAHSLTLKESRGPLTAFRLLGIRRAGIGRALTPLVDREEELEAMRAWAEEALSGKGRVLCLVGEAGAGKSRLKYELKRFLAEKYVEVVEAAALSYGRSFSYWPFLEILRELLRLSPQDGHSEIHARLSVLGGVLELGGHDVEHLAWLLHAQLPNGPGIRLDPPAQKAATFLAMKRLLLTLSERRPLVLMLEDMQWSDPLTRELLAFLVGALSRAPILMVCLYRPEYDPEWIGRPEVKVIPVRELEPESIRLLMAKLLGWEEVPTDLAQAVLGRAEGNPFFLEELLRSLSEQGVLAWRGERCERVGRLEQAEIPDTLQTLVAARVDKLPETEKRVLQRASTIGRSFSLALLERVCQDGPKGWREALATLEEEGMIFLHARDGEPEYHFKQLLTREAACQSLARGAARECHGEVARALESLFPDRAQEVPELLAWHWGQAGEVRKEVEYLLRAGDRHRENVQNAEAVAAYGQALELLLSPGPDKAGDPNEERRRRFQAHFGRAKAFEYLGRLPEGIADGEHALEAAEILGDTPKTVVALNGLASLHGRRAEYRETLSHAGRALKMAETTSLESEAAASLLLLAMAHRERGSSDKAFPFVERAVALHRKLGERQPLVADLTLLAFLLAEKGNPDRALGLLEEATALCRENGDSFGLASSLASIAGFRAQKGDADAALAAYEESLAIRRELGDRLGVAATLITLGAFHSGGGEHAKALKAYQESAALSRELGDRRGLAAALVYSGQALRDQGQHPEALEVYEEAFLIQMQLGDRPGMGASLTAIGDLHAQGGRWEEALRSQSEAAALHRDLGSGKELAQDLCRMGEALLSLDRPEEAQARVEEGLAFTAGIQNRAPRADLLVTLGRVKTLLGSPEDAWDSIVEGMDLGREMDLQGVVVKGWLALGDLAMKKGDGKESRKCYEAAYDSAKAAGLAHWTRELEKKLGFEEKG